MTDSAAIVLSSRAWLLPALLTLAVLAGVVVWSYRRNAAERWVALLCGGLRLAGLAALAACLLEPLWVSQRARPGANVFALLADNSQSLQIKDSGQEHSRGELLRTQLATDPLGWQNTLEQTFQVRRYTFDSRLQSTRDFSDLNFDGRASAIGVALRSAIERWRGQPVAGVLLFTDGNATDLAADLPPLDGCPPIYPVILGIASGLRDVSLDKVAVSQT
ncbi:MAG: glutamine amidotransferase, partial [Limisphaerales bacterium]